jgi:hypothetical protein
MLVCLFYFLLLSIPPASAKPTNELIQSFVSAYVAVKQPKINNEDLEHYFSFMEDNITDYHAAYKVTIKGKDKKRQGIIKKASNMVSFSMEIESIILGSQSAVFVVNEDSKYYKDEKLKHFKGRTIMVLEFNEKGLIKHMRRYLD